MLQLLLGVNCRGPVPVWSSWDRLHRQPAGAVGKSQSVLGKAFGLCEQAAELVGEACTCVWGCRTGSVLRRCLLPHVGLPEHGLLGALGLQTNRFCASQADSRDGLLFIIFVLPGLLSPSAFCRGWGD